jgi:hypothetical protein
MPCQDAPPTLVENTTNCGVVQTSGIPVRLGTSETGANGSISRLVSQQDEVFGTKEDGGLVRHTNIAPLPVVTGARVLSSVARRLSSPSAMRVGTNSRAYSVT